MESRYTEIQYGSGERVFFPLLAKNLWADRDELYATFPVYESATDLRLLRMVIQSELDQWFDTSDDRNNPDV